MSFFTAQHKFTNLKLQSFLLTRVCIWANTIYYYFFYFIYQTFGFHWGSPNQIMIRNFKVVCIRIYKFIIFYDSFIMRSSFFINTWTIISYYHYTRLYLLFSFFFPYQKKNILSLI
jgi:hypothetical protein